jgi:hypothetical protein
MKRRAHRQEHRALRAFFAADLHGALDRGLLARDHHLAGRVEVHRLHDAAGLPARRAHRFVLEHEDRRHGALAFRHRFLHRLAAEANERQAVLESDRAGRDERGVFAQAVAGDEIGLRPAQRAPRLVGRIPRGHHGGLRVHGERQLFRRALVEDPHEFLAERAPRLRQRVLDTGQTGVRFQHSHGLGALPGEHHGELHNVTRLEPQVNPPPTP